MLPYPELRWTLELNGVREARLEGLGKMADQPAV